METPGRPRARHGLRLAGGFLGLALCAAGEARAQDLQQVTVAKALYEHAMTAMSAGDYPTACRALEEATRLEDKAIGAKIMLAECYERLGKLATAWTTYTLAEEAAVRTNQPDRQKRAHELGEALRPKLARLTIEVPSEMRALPGLRIERDGIPIGPALFGVPVPVDRGHHVIQWEVPGLRRVVKELDVADGAAVVVDVVAYPRLVIEVSSAVRALQSLEIRLDGAPLEAARWGAPLMVDKGHHLVEASAPKRVPFVTPIELKEEGAVVIAKVPMLDVIAPRSRLRRSLSPRGDRGSQAVCCSAWAGLGSGLARSPA